MNPKTPNQKIIVSNKKAYHEYFILDKYTAGLVLVGTEVKALRAGKANISEAWIDIENDEAFLLGAHISPYSHGNQFNHNETRKRKLLLKKKEIIDLESALSQKGLTIVALQLFLQDSLFKIEIALAKGKKLHDKRDASAAKDANRDIQRAMRRN